MTKMTTERYMRLFEMTIEACKMLRLDWRDANSARFPDYVREVIGDTPLLSVGYATDRDGRETLAVARHDDADNRIYVEVHVWGTGRDGLHGWQFFEYGGISGFTPH